MRRIATILVLLGWSIAGASLQGAEPGNNLPVSARETLNRPSTDGHPLARGEGGTVPNDAIPPPDNNNAWRTSINKQLDASITRLLAEKEAPRVQTLTSLSAEDTAAPAFATSVKVDSAREKQGQAAMIAQLLQKNGLSSALTSVVAVESAFNPQALSPKGASGLWQLMPQTARRYGLRVERNLDERTDPVKSTHAAAAYLKDLFVQFRDWPLVLAAYNAGEDRVARALVRTGTTDFWSLQRHGALPEETLDYVPAVLQKLDVPLHAPEAENSASPATSRNAGHVTYATTAAE